MVVEVSVGRHPGQVWDRRPVSADFLEADEVWAADITYVPMYHGFMYLVAILDLHSRYVLAGGCPTLWRAIFVWTF